MFGTPHWCGVLYLFQVSNVVKGTNYSCFRNACRNLQFFFLFSFFFAPKTFFTLKLFLPKPLVYTPLKLDSTAANLTFNICQLILLRTLAGCYG